MAQTRTQKVKHRLCWNCEGNAPVTEKNCPYCGVYLGLSIGEPSLIQVGIPFYKDLPFACIPEFAATESKDSPIKHLERHKRLGYL